jgi:hypothetical protein
LLLQQYLRTTTDAIPLLNASRTLVSIGVRLRAATSAGFARDDGRDVPFESSRTLGLTRLHAPQMVMASRHSMRSEAAMLALRYALDRRLARRQSKPFG